MRRAFLTIAVGAMIASSCTGGTTDTTSGSPEGDRPSASTSADATQPPGTNPPGERARLLHAFDGDSLEAEVDGATVEVRLIGINTPEGDECHGDAARAALESMLDGRDLVLETGAEDTDQFDRLLRYVWVDGIDVNAWMLAQGHAVVLQGDHARDGAYRDLFIEAADARRGLWADDACGSATTPPALEIDDIEYDPSGRDFENALNEWVDIANRDTADIDLTGWILRDESSQHRYVFGTVILRAGEVVRVRSGCGDDRDLDLVWCAGDAVWSNGGDTAILQNADGTVVDWLSYPGDY